MTARSRRPGRQPLALIRKAMNLQQTQWPRPWDSAPRLFYVVVHADSQLSAGHLDSTCEGHDKETIWLIHSIVMLRADPKGNRRTE